VVIEQALGGVGCGAVVACIGGIESSEKFAEDTASPCHGELIVFSLFLLAFSSRFFESLVSGLRCLLLSLVSGCPFLASVNKLRKGKDAAAERLCSTLTNAEVLAYHNRRSAVERVDGALRLCERTPPERNGHAGATTSAAGIWVEGCFEPGTGIGLLVDVNRNATIV